MDALLHQSEAWEFVRPISDPTQRLLMELAVTMAYSTLATDPEYRRTAADHPLDLLMFARAAGHVSPASSGATSRWNEGSPSLLVNRSPLPNPRAGGQE